MVPHPGRFAVVSFDCYGTLIDWETGILGALGPVLERHGVELERGRLLGLYAELESRAQGSEYVGYREVLREVVRGLGRRLGFAPSARELDCLADSLGDWRPFPDTVEALRALERGYHLAVISNVDDDLFALSAKRLEVGFDWVVTAQQARAYKPSLRTFRLALDRIGLPAARILHVAQSVYHDILPAQALGLATVWVDRSGGPGATPPARGRADLEVANLASLAAMTAPHAENGGRCRI